MLFISLTILGYAGLLVYVALRKEIRASRVWLLAYIGWSFVVSAAYALTASDAQLFGYGAGIPTTISYFVSLGLLGALTISYIGWKAEWAWPAVASLGVLLLLGADLAGILPQIHALSWRDALANGSILVPLAIAVLWGLGHGFNFVLTFIAMTRARLPLHANHLLLWLIVLPVIVIAEVTAAWSTEPFAGLGRLLRLVGAIGMVYGVTATRILDVRNTFRTSLGNAVLVTITAAIMLTGIAISQPILNSLSGVVAILAVAGIALILAFIYQILRGVTENLVRRAVMRSGYDPANVAAKYAQRIARQLRFDELAATAAKTLRTSVEASKGGLVLLTPNGASARADVYAGLGEFPTDVLNLPSKSPVLRTMLSSRRPLLQYNIDLDKEFKELSEPEREWLQKLNMDVFVPILDGDDLSGMLAVGQRMSGDPYRRSELDLMMSIADQTSVALNNARLFENMRTLNNEMKSLNSNLMTTNEQLEEMDRVKTDFITIASHELRTPLTQMRGYADVMDALASQGTISPEQVTQFTESLLTASDRLDAIIGQMLDASQIDIDAMELSFDEITIESVLKRSVQPYADAMRARGQTMAVQGLQLLPSLWADKRRLVQAFQHLVGNAIKYTPDGGRIEIRAGYLPRDADRRDSIEVLLVDSGVGIDPKYHELVFEKFFRIGSTDLHSSGNTKFMGAGPGLGLPIAKGVIEAHGGEIWVESTGFDMEKFPGTTMHVILPVQPPAISAAAEAEIKKDVFSLDPDAWDSELSRTQN